MRETPAAAAAFEEYCALGDSGIRRSLEKLHELYQLRARQAPDKKIYVPSLTTLKIWSGKHSWQQKVKIYDAEQIAKEAEERRRKRDEAIEAMNDRHIMIGTSQQKRAIEQIQRLIEAQKFGSQATVQLLKLATDLERVARGAPTEHIEQSGMIEVQRNPDLATLTDEELDQLMELLRRASERQELADAARSV